MDLGSALNSIMEYDIKEHCHINSNEDGDRFVGIKADSDNAMVYFPIGYEAFNSSIIRVYNKG